MFGWIVLSVSFFHKLVYSLSLELLIAIWSIFAVGLDIVNTLIIIRLVRLCEWGYNYSQDISALNPFGQQAIWVIYCNRDKPNFDLFGQVQLGKDTSEDGLQSILVLLLVKLSYFLNYWDDLLQLILLNPDNEDTSLAIEVRYDLLSNFFGHILDGVSTAKVCDWLLRDWKIDIVILI